MAERRTAYRVRVYAARSVDPTEATLLTPAAGAAHSDEFKIASISGVSGYQPYLHEDVQVRRGRIDLRSRKLTIGTCSFRTIDKKTSTDNLTRWVTAYFGNVKGRPPGRLRLEVDECLDTTATSPTWTRYFTGEITSCALENKIDYIFDARERSETAKMTAFVGKPHTNVTYAAIPTLLPIGFRGSDYGLQQATLPLTGTMGKLKVNATDYEPAGEMSVFLDRDSVRHSQNILTRGLREAVPPNQAFEHHDPASSTERPRAAWIPSYTGKARCHLKRLDTSAEGDFRVGGLMLQYETKDGRTHSRVAGFSIQELTSTDAGYLAVPPAATAVEVMLYCDEDVSPARPLLIDDVDPAQLLQDLLDGYFGYIYRGPQVLPTGKSYGDVVRAVAHTGMSSFEGIWPTMRFVITKPESLLPWIEKHILIPCHWALTPNASGQLTLVDLRMPTSTAGVATITDVDVVADADPDWKHDPTQAILRVDCVRYSERLKSAADLWASSEYTPELSDGGIMEEVAHPMESLYIGSIDYGDSIEKIDARGYRSQDAEQYQAQPRSVYLDQKLREVARHLQRPLGTGLTSTSLRCRRTATVEALTIGGLVIVDVDALPDPGTHVRGGAMLCRILDKSEDGPEALLELAYLASTTTADAPTLAQPAQETGNTYTGITSAVTVNAAAHPVEVRYAVTSTAASIPADDSPLWTVSGQVTATSTHTIRNVPPGMRVWVQGRSLPDYRVESYLPSAWTNAGGNGRVDTAALTAPSALTATTVNHKSVTLGWTNGQSDLGIEILLATPT